MSYPLRMFVVLTLAIGFGLGLNLPAHSQSIANVPVRKIFVPADVPESWPEGDWIPIPSKRLRQEASDLGSAATSARWAQTAQYEATLNRDALVQGRLRMKFAHAFESQLDDGPSLISWPDTPMAFSNLSWGSKPAKLGNISTGKGFLIVPPENQTLVGSWSLQGRSLVDGVYFDLQFPSAAVTEFVLNLPRSHQLKVLDENVPLTEQSSNSPQERSIRMSLGSRAKVRFFVEFANSDAEKVRNAQLLARAQTLVLLARDQSRLRQELLIESLGASVDSVTIPVPENLQIRSVDYGGLAINSWSVTRDPPHLLTIKFPEPIEGSGRPLNINGQLSYNESQLWRVPRLWPIKSHPLSEEVTLNVAPPHELLAIQHEGFRQSGSSTSTTGTSSMTFQRSSPIAEIDVRVGLPPKRLKTEFVTRVERRDDSFLADVQLLGTVDSGRLYTAWMELAPGWDPINVEFLDRSTMRLTPDLPWAIETLNGLKTLRVDFPKAVNRDQPLQLMMSFRGTPEQSSSPQVPVVRMTGEIPSQQALLVHRNDVLASDTSFELAGWSQLYPSEVPVWVQNAKTSFETDLDSANWDTLVAGNPGLMELPLVVDDDTNTVTIVDRIALVVDDSQNVAVQEDLELRLDVESDDVSSTRLTTMSPVDLSALNWKLLGDEDTQVKCQRAEGGLRNDGVNVWELLFTPPLQSSSLVLASRQFPHEKQLQAILPLLSEAKCVGKVVVNAPPDLTESSLNSVDSGYLKNPPPEQFLGIYSSLYSNEKASLEIQVTGASLAPEQRIIDVSLKSELISASSEMLSHQMLIQILDPAPQLQIGYAGDLSKLAIFFNGKPVAYDELESGQLRLELQSPVENINRLELLWRSPIVSNLTDSTGDISIPQINLAAGQGLQWELHLPPGCRIEDYSDTVLLASPQAQPHWSQRLFGLLGRDHDNHFFNPFNAEQWSGLFHPVIEKPPVFQPAIEFESRQIPRTLTLTICSPSRHQAFAWVIIFVTLFSGFSLRITRWQSRKTLAAWALAIALIACSISPDSWVIYSGSFTAALIFVLIFPRVFLMGRRSLMESGVDATQISEPSTLRRVSVGLLLVGTAFYSGSHLLAQFTPTPVTAQSLNGNAVSTPVDLLIPYVGDEPDEQLPDLIYIRESQRQSSLFKSSGSVSPAMISSANYVCQLSPQGPAALNVNYLIEVPRNSTLDFFELPLQGANLSREEGCLVNGEPVSVAMTEGGTLEIPLPQETDESGAVDRPLRAPRPGKENGASNIGYRSVTVELNLYASIDVRKSIRQFQLQIPPVSVSQFSCSWPNEYDIHQLTGLQGAMTNKTPTSLQADLGNSREVTLQWHLGQENASNDELTVEPQLSLKPQYLVEVFPTHMNYRIRVAHSLDSGAVSTIQWELPAQFYFRKVLTQSILQTREYLQDEKRIVLFDLPRDLDSSSEPYLIDAEFVVPISSQEEDEIVVVVPTLTNQQELSADFSLKENSNAIVGIWSPPEMPLTLLEVPLDGLKNLPTEDYLDRWPQSSTLPKPQLAYELGGPISLSFLRSESQPQKKVWVKETGVIDEQFLEWEWSGEVQTSQLPAFEHEFLVDSRLEILSVSVKEDQAERVTRWSRDGNRLTVRLTRKAEESSQDVRIEARMSLGVEKNPDSNEEELTLPAIRLLTGERMESIAQLLLVPTRTARWKEERTRGGRSGAASLRNRPEELLNFDLFSRLDRNPANDTLVIGERSFPPHLRRSIRISKRSDGDFDVDCELYDLQPEFISGALELMIPESWVARLRVELKGDPGVDIERELNEDGRLRLVLPEGGRGPSLILRTTISPPDANNWAVPWPEVIGDATYQNLVELKLAEGWAPRQECRLLDDEYAVANDAEESYERWEYLCDQLELQKTELTDPDAIPSIPLFLSRVDVRSGKVTLGQWWLMYRGRGQERLELELPFPALIHSIRRGNEVVNYDFDEELNRLEIPLTQNKTWQSLSINWQSQQPLEGQMLSEMNLPFPQVLDVKVRQQRIVIIAPSNLKLVMHHGVLPQSHIEYRLTLLETLTRLIKDESFDIADLPQEVRGLLRSLIEGSQEEQRNLQENRSFLNRYEKAQRELLPLLPEEFLENDFVSNSNQEEVDRLLTSDYFAGTENTLILPGRTIVYAVVDSNSDSMKVWWLERFWYLIGLAIVGAAVMIPLFCWLFRESTANWFARHRVYLWMLIGTIWWFCLKLSFIGLVVFGIAVIAWLVSPLFARSRSY